MKKLTLLVILALALAGCASNAQVTHSTVLGTDASGYATGHFTDNRSGSFCTVAFGTIGYGSGSGAATTATTAGKGLGGVGFTMIPPPTQADPTPFARSIAMINYSRTLTKLKIDYDGIIDYEFTDKPVTKRGHQPSFGPTPIK